MPFVHLFRPLLPPPSLGLSFATAVAVAVAVPVAVAVLPALSPPVAFSLFCSGGHPSSARRRPSSLPPPPPSLSALSLLRPGHRPSSPRHRPPSLLLPLYSHSPRPCRRSDGGGDPWRKKARKRAQHPIRICFIPFFATGHMIPLVDIARLFAARGVDSTVLLTLANAALVQHTIDCAVATGLPLRTFLYPFPSDAASLPSRREHQRAPPFECHKIDAACLLTRPDHDRLLRLHRPNAVVANTHFL